MKYLILIIALISTLSADFDWPGEYDEALVEAKKEHKDIYLLIGSAYCKFCNRFEKNVLENKEVLKRLKKDFVLLYLSTDIDDIPTHLKKNPIPRHYFLDANGDIIHTTIGYRDVEGFYEVLDDFKMLKED